MICAPDGGVLDDLIVYRLSGEEFLVVANAANTPAVSDALRQRADGRAASVADHTADYALIAIQGPRAAGILAPLASIDLAGVKYYTGRPAEIAGARGAAGQDRVHRRGRVRDLHPARGCRAGVGRADRGRGRTALVPAGLAARDTLRLEAGMPLYGNELGPDVTPFDAGLGRVVKFDKPGDFVGRAALAERAQAAPRRTLTGLAGQSRRVPRHGYDVLWDGQPGGTVTSGAPSPTLGMPIAMAYLDPDVARQAAGEAAAGRLAVDVRGSAEPAVLVPLPFYHRPA